MRNFLELLKDAFVIWFERGCESMAAAVSYYAMFALVPLIFVSVYIVSLIFGEELVTKVMLSWGSGMGTGVITLLQNAVAELPNSPLVSLAPIGTLFFLLAAVVIFFNTLTEGFHHLFGVSHSGVRGLLRKSGRALVVVIVLQFFIMGLIAAEFGFALFFEGLAIRSYATTGVYIGALFILFTLSKISKSVQRHHLYAQSTYILVFDIGILAAAYL